MLVGIANIVDMQLIGNGSVLRTAVIFFYISNEGLSIVENAAVLGLPIPNELRNVLKQLRGKNGKAAPKTRYIKGKGKTNDDSKEDN